MFFSGSIKKWKYKKCSPCMNIAILIPGLEGGGAERVASLIGNYYIEQGHNVYYFISKNSKRCAYEVKGKIIRTEIVANQNRIMSLFKAAFIMRKYKIKYDIDVSISFMEEFNYINILSRIGDKIIISTHTTLSQRPELREQSLLYDKKTIHFFYNHADKLVVMNDYAKKDMEHIYKVKKRKLIKIPNPISSLKKSTSRTEWIYGSNVVICIGRLIGVKQHNVAIRAFSTVVKEKPDAKMIILGEGPDKNKLNILIKKLNLENNVFLLGFQKDIFYFLQNAKVFLMTSYTEGFPCSMVEAMSAGIPVISTNSPGGQKEILKPFDKIANIQYGAYGIITPYIKNNYMAKEPITHEEQMLGQAITEMLLNDTLREKYAKAALKRAQMYNTERIMAIWNKIINT